MTIQTVSIVVTPVNAPMTEAEARASEKRIIEHVDGLRMELVTFHARRGWHALGFPSWRAWAMARLARSVSAVYRELKAGEIALQIMPDGDIDEIPEGVIRPLSKVTDADQRRSVWQAAALAAGGVDRVTARHISAAINVLTEAVATGGMVTDVLGEQGSIIHAVRAEAEEVLQRAIAHRAAPKTEPILAYEGTLSGLLDQLQLLETDPQTPIRALIRSHKPIP